MGGSLVWTFGKWKCSKGRMIRLTRLVVVNRMSRQAGWRLVPLSTSACRCRTAELLKAMKTSVAWRSTARSARRKSLTDVVFVFHWANAANKKEIRQSGLVYFLCTVCLKGHEQWGVGVLEKEKKISSKHSLILALPFLSARDGQLVSAHTQQWTV